MMRLSYLAILAFALSPSVAKACECEWPQYSSSQDIYFYEISKADVAFEGIPVSHRLVNKIDSDPVAELKFRITRCVKGHCGKFIVVRSYGGYTGANCGMANALDVPITPKLHIWVAGKLAKTGTVPDRSVAWIDSCSGLFQKSEPTGHKP